MDGCYVCNNAYRPGSKPRWLFGSDGRLLGTVHTSCSPPPGHLTINTGYGLEEARFLAWVWWSGYAMSGWLRLLWDVPVREELTNEQWVTITCWVRQDKIDAREAVALVEEHRAMIAAYRAWLSEEPQP